MPHCSKNTAVIIGAAGNVGKGILHAFLERSSHWDVVAVDPAFPEQETPSSNNQFIQSAVEDVSEETFQSWLRGAHVEFIITNDCGNRDVYAENPDLGVQNEIRFGNLAKRIVAARDNSNKAQVKCENESKVSVHISYIGGSWTRRKPEHHTPGVISDESPVKPGGGSNPYEIAKSNAHEKARKISMQWDLAITFYDYISVVPNYAPNFSLNQMTESGLENGVIRFSSGDYGRPLLHASEAGEFVAKIVEGRIQNDKSCSDRKNFETVLVPGHFVTFQVFADIAKDAIESKTGSNKGIVFETYEKTPAELRTRCVSSVPFVINSSLVMKGLRQTAMASVESLSR